MWLWADLVAELCFLGLVSASAEDDGPSRYAPSPAEYPNPLLVRTNPPSPPVTRKLPTGPRAKEEFAIAPHPRSAPDANASLAFNK
jgi:hypothetical protein